MLSSENQVKSGNWVKKLQYSVLYQLVTPEI